MVNSGHLLENLVFTALRRITPNIYYYKTQAGREVDFIAGDHKSTRMLVQVCETMANQKTRKREILALAEAMSEQKLSKGYIITRNEEEQIQVDSGTIEVKPAWRFLLNIAE